MVIGAARQHLEALNAQAADAVFWRHDAAIEHELLFLRLDLRLQVGQRRLNLRVGRAVDLAGRFADGELAPELVADGFLVGKLPFQSRALAALQKRGKTELAVLLRAADSRGETWTHAFRKEDSYSRVDHILVSPGLAPSVVGNAAAIYDGASVREASDHRPVFVVLRLEGK